MTLAVEIFLTLIAISAIISLLLGLFLLNRKDAPGALYLALAEFACAIWSMGYFIELSAVPIEIKLIGIKLQYCVGIPAVPYFWYAATRHLTTLKQRPRKLELALIGIIPFISVCMGLTVDMHSMFYISPHIHYTDGFSLIEKEKGFWFLVHIYYSYLLLLSATILLLNSLRKARKVFKRQTTLLLTGICFPWISNILYVAGMNSFMRLDFTNIAFTLAAVLFAWSIYRFDLFELVPMAKDLIIESLQTGIIVLDPKLRIVDYNKTAARLFGNRFTIGLTVDPIIKDYGFSVGMINESPNKKIEFKSADEYFEIGLVSVIDQSSELSGFVITIYNITNKIRTAKELEALNATKDKFFSIIAHDLKNPMFGLMAISEMMLNNESAYLEPDERPEMMQRMHDLTKKTYALLENLLDWARSQRGAMKVTPVQFQLREQVYTVIEQLYQNAALKNIAIEVAQGPDCAITADINMIHTVLRNLISNAVKFTPQNGKVKIGLEPAGKEVIISISDNGIGMTEEQIVRLFNLKKESTPGTNGESGTGLGLIVTKEFIDIHNGVILVNSIPGAGTTFTVTLPLSYNDHQGFQ